MPLFLNLTSRLVVIFGGGKVGERKAGLFSQYGPVKVLSRDFSPGLLDLAADPQRQIELVECDLSCDFAKYLQGAFIAIPATSDSKLNRAIEEEAAAQGILVNKVEDVGDVVVPSILQRGSIAIAISTQIPWPYQVSSPPAGRGAVRQLSGHGTIALSDKEGEQRACAHAEGSRRHNLGDTIGR